MLKPEETQQYSNPLPHVLMLTAIVVGVATLGLALALCLRIQQGYGTVEEDELLVKIERSDARYSQSPLAKAKNRRRTRVVTPGSQELLLNQPNQSGNLRNLWKVEIPRRPKKRLPNPICLSLKKSQHPPPESQDLLPVRWRDRNRPPPKPLLRKHPRKPGPQKRRGQNKWITQLPGFYFSL